MQAIFWYWVILVLWVVLSLSDLFTDDSRLRRGGNVVLIVLLFLIGYMISGSPLK